MRRATLCFSAVALLLAILPGCAAYTARFTPPVAQENIIKLKENDFHYVATNLTGTADVWYIFGAIALGDNRLFSRALAEMYSGAQDMVTGRSTQLVNWTVDETDFYPIPPLYGILAIFPGIHKHTVIMRADLIEFTK